MPATANYSNVLLELNLVRNLFGQVVLLYLQWESYKALRIPTLDRPDGGLSPSVAEEGAVFLPGLTAILAAHNLKSLLLRNELGSCQ